MERSGAADQFLRECGGEPVRKLPRVKRLSISFCELEPRILPCMPELVSNDIQKSCCLSFDRRLLMVASDVTSSWYPIGHGERCSLQMVRRERLVK